MNFEQFKKSLKDKASKSDAAIAKAAAESTTITAKSSGSFIHDYDVSQYVMEAVHLLDGLNLWTSVLEDDDYEEIMNSLLDHLKKHKSKGTSSEAIESLERIRTEVDVLIERYSTQDKHKKLSDYIEVASATYDGSVASQLKPRHTKLEQLWKSLDKLTVVNGLYPVSISVDEDGLVTRSVVDPDKQVFLSPELIPMYYPYRKVSDVVLDTERDISLYLQDTTKEAMNIMTKAFVSKEIDKKFVSQHPFLKQLVSQLSMLPSDERTKLADYYEKEAHNDVMTKLIRHCGDFLPTSLSEEYEVVDNFASIYDDIAKSLPAIIELALAHSIDLKTECSGKEHSIPIMYMKRLYTLMLHHILILRKKDASGKTIINVLPFIDLVSTKEPLNYKNLAEAVAAKTPGFKWTAKGIFSVAALFDNAYPNCLLDVDALIKKQEAVPTNYYKATKTDTKMEHLQTYLKLALTYNVVDAKAVNYLFQILNHKHYNNADDLMAPFLYNIVPSVNNHLIKEHIGLDWKIIKHEFTKNSVKLKCRALLQSYSLDDVMKVLLSIITMEDSENSFFVNFVKIYKAMDISHAHTAKVKHLLLEQLPKVYQDICYHFFDDSNTYITGWSISELNQEIRLKYNKNNSSSQIGDLDESLFIVISKLMDSDFEAAEKEAANLSDNIEILLETALE